MKSSHTVITCQIIHYLLDSRTAVKIVFKLKEKNVGKREYLVKSSATVALTFIY